MISEKEAIEQAKCVAVEAGVDFSMFEFASINFTQSQTTLMGKVRIGPHWVISFKNIKMPHFDPNSIVVYVSSDGCASHIPMMI